MKLQNKVFLSVFPIIAATFIVIGWQVTNFAVDSAHDSVFRYLEGTIETYVSQDLAARADLLKRNRLEDIPSFVESYQKEAMETATKLEFIWPGHIFIFDKNGTVFFDSAGELHGPLPEEWHELHKEIVHGGRIRIEGYSKGKQHESFTAQRFEPWGWFVVFAVSDEIIHTRKENIRLSVAFLGILSTITIILSLGFVFHSFVLTPVRHMRKATAKIAFSEKPVTVSVPDGDEFGELSRDIETMSGHICESRENLKKTYEDLQSLDDMKSSLITNVSHELRTPLTSIMGFSKLGLKKIRGPLACFLNEKDNHHFDKLKSTLEKSFQVIEDQSGLMARIIENIIDLMFLLSDEARPELKSGNMADMVRHTCEIYRAQAEEKGLSMEIRIPATPLPVKADSAMIHRTLSHYLDNALSFTKQGGIKIKACLDGDFVVVEVLDTGPGLSPEATEQIFEQFYQVGEMMTDKPKGLGIGLSICKEIIRLHGGRTWVKSTPGKGTSFFFSLPVLDTAET